MSLSPPPTNETRAALKRRIATLEIENAGLVSHMVKKPVHSYVREGRAIRRLVSLADPVTDLIAEYDRHIMLVENESEVESLRSSEVEERTYRSYKKLVLWCPSVQELVKSTTQGYKMATACQDVSVSYV
ncbi:hypothetical protein JVT61DRAFT_8551 [Boletus reticuloceps]|uniref:Uncharacterized protein n=1 Tax=Boletus reticuloceps TaxID=495285 RepID=A0A8I3AFH0_9AGAM|nr:hypothetical protein JVT61DRAFT_8551 [Boletus reticuloceps]